MFAYGVTRLEGPLSVPVHCRNYWEDSASWANVKKFARMSSLGKVGTLNSSQRADWAAIASGDGVEGAGATTAAVAGAFRKGGAQSMAKKNRQSTRTK